MEPDVPWISGWTARPRSPRRSNEEMGRAVDYRLAERDGAARAAALIAELL
jgi:hypothetical protein